MKRLNSLVCKKFIQNIKGDKIYNKESLINNQVFELQKSVEIPKENNLKFKCDKELDWGEIPYELNFDRKNKTSILSNGISVTTLDYSSPIISISVFIRCGSVDESLEASGSAHFLEHMHFKGTPKRNKKQLEMEIESKGAHLNAYTTRDYTSYILNVFKEEIDWGVELLSDILTKSLYLSNFIERERDTIYTELIECEKEEFETILENSHYTVFKDHPISRPILGLKENIMSVTRDQIVEFHTRNYCGQKILFSVTGEVDHDNLKFIINKHFGHLPSTSNIPALVYTKPEFKPRVTLTDGPDGFLKAGMFWEAPSWFDEDYIPFLILQRIVGDYKKSLFDLPNNNQSCNKFSNLLASVPEIETIKTAFTPYKDVGLFGMFVECEDKYGEDTLLFLRAYIQDLYINISETDILNARSQLFGELVMIDVGTDVSQDAGTYLTYYKRVVSKSEIAKRISLACNPEVLKNVLLKWIFNKKPGITLWGPYQHAKNYANLLK